MQSPKVAVVVLNWNGAEYLQKFLPSVTETVYSNLDIYVADNASTDESISYVRAHFPEVKIILNSGNLGFAGGYNEALAKIQADYFVLLNQDVEVTEDWISPIITLMEKDATIGACQPKIKSWQHPDFFEYAGASGGWIDRFGYPFCRGRVFRTIERDKGQYDDIQQTFWASGAALFIRAALFQKAGGFDPDFFAHMEEIDLCWRLQLMGFKIMVCPQSVVYHVGGGSLAQGSPQKVYLNFRNNLIMMYKNLSPKERTSILLARRLLDGAAAAKNVFGGNYKEIKSIWKAHRSFHKWKALEKKRPGKRVTASSSFLELPGVYNESIVWDYFVNKKKTFPKTSFSKK